MKQKISKESSDSASTVVGSDCNSGNSDFRISGTSVFPQVPKFRNFSSKNSGNSWLPFFALLGPECLFWDWEWDCY